MIWGSKLVGAGWPTYLCPYVTNKEWVHGRTKADAMHKCRSPDPTGCPHNMCSLTTANTPLYLVLSKSHTKMVFPTFCTRIVKIACIYELIWDNVRVIFGVAFIGYRSVQVWWVKDMLYMLLMFWRGLMRLCGYELCRHLVSPLNERFTEARSQQETRVTKSTHVRKVWSESYILSSR